MTASIICLLSKFIYTWFGKFYNIKQLEVYSVKEEKDFMHLTLFLFSQIKKSSLVIDRAHPAYLQEVLSLQA